MRAAPPLLLTALTPPAAGSWDSLNKLMTGVEIPVGSMTLPVPEISIPLVSFEGEVELRDAVVANVSISELDIVPSADGEGATTVSVAASLDLRITTGLGVGITVRAIGLPIQANGNGSAVITAALGLRLAATFRAPRPDVGPETVEVDSCEAGATTVHFDCTCPPPYPPDCWPNLAIPGADSICSLFNIALGPPLFGPIACGMLDADGVGVGAVLANLSRDLAGRAAAPAAPRPPTSEAEAGLSGLAGVHPLPNIAGASAVIDRVWGAEGSSGGLIVNQIVRKATGQAAPGQVTLAGGALGFGLPDSGLIRDARVGLVNATARGLDTFTRLRALDRVGNYSVDNAVALADAALDLWLNVSLVTGPAVVPPGRHVSVLLHMAAEVRDFELNATLLLANNGTLLGGLPVYGLFHDWGGLLDCLAVPLVRLDVSYLRAALTSATLRTTAAVAEPPLGASGGLDALAAGALSAAALLYGAPVAAALPNLTQSIGALPLAPLLDPGHARCAAAPAPAAAPGAVVDLSENTALALASFLLNDVGGDIGADYDLNAVIRALSDDGAGDFRWPGDVAAAEVRQFPGFRPQPVRIGRLRVAVRNLTVAAGAAGVGAFALLRPRPAPPRARSDPHTIDTAVNYSAATAEWEFEYDWERVGHAGPERRIRNRVQVRSDLRGLHMMLSVMLLLSQQRLNGLSVSEASDVGCMLHAIDPEGLRLPGDDTWFDAAEAAITMRCDECTSAVLPRLAAALSSPDGHAATTRWLRDGLAWLSRSGDTDGARRLADGLVAAAQCPAPAPPAFATASPPDMSTADAVRAVVFFGMPCALLGAIVAWAATRAARVRRDGRGETRPLTLDVPLSPPPPGEGGGAAAPPLPPPGEPGLLRADEALCRSAAVTPCAQRGVPLLCAAALGVLLSAHMDKWAAHVSFVATLAGEDVTISAYEVSIWNLTADLWEAGQHFLGVFMGGVSGAWPYMKLILLAWAWTAPPTLLAPSSRGWLLAVLDILQKWSLAEPMVVILLAVLSYKDMSAVPPDAVPGAEEPIEGVADLGMRMQLGWGMFGFLLSQLLNLVASHWAVVCHRDAVVADEAVRGGDADVRPRRERRRSHPGTAGSRASTWFDEGAASRGHEALCDHLFRRPFVPLLLRPDQGAGFAARFDAAAKWLLAAVIALAAGLTVWGVVADSVSFGLIVFIDTRPKSEWMTDGAVVDMVSKLWTVSGGEGAGTRAAHLLLSAVTAVLLIGLPLLLGALMAALWLAPLSISTQKRALFGAECAFAASAAEVYFVGAVILIISAGDLIHFIIGDSCDGPIDAAVAALEAAGMLPNNQAGAGECGGARGEPRAGLWPLLAGSVLNIAAWLFLRSATKAALRDRTDALRPGAHPGDDGYADDVMSCTSTRTRPKDKERILA